MSDSTIILPKTEILSIPPVLPDLPVQDSPLRAVNAKVNISINPKKCTKCKNIKPTNEFYKHPKTKDGYGSYCKECANEASLCWQKANPEKKRKRSQQWYKVNTEACCQRARRASIKNRKTLKGRLNHSISRSITQSLFGNKNGRHWESLVGYTLEQLKKHLEKQFLPDMTWENRNEWHIDHIIPKVVFNFRKPEDIDFKRCWALKNLRPLWAKENRQKNAKIINPFQPSLGF